MAGYDHSSLLSQNKIDTDYEYNKKLLKKNISALAEANLTKMELIKFDANTKLAEGINLRTNEYDLNHLPCMSGNFGYGGGGGGYIAEKWNNDFGFDDDQQSHEKCNKTISALREQIREHIDKISWHKKRETFMQHTKTDLELTIIDLRREVKHLKTLNEIGDIEFDNAEMSSVSALTHRVLEKDNRELRETVRKLQAQLKELRDFDNDILAARLEIKPDVTPRLKDAELLSDRIRLLTRQNYRLSKINKELQTEVEQLKENQLSDHINFMNMSQKYNEIAKDNKDLKIKNKTFKTEVNELKSELVENSRVMDVVKSTESPEYEEMRQKYIRCLSNKMTTMENKELINNLIAKLDNTFSDSSNFDDQLKELVALNNVLQIANRNSIALVEQCQQDIESQSEIIVKLEKEKTILVDDVTRIRNAMSINIEKLSDQSKKSIEYERIIGILETEISHQNDTIISLKEKINGEEVTIKSLREELNKKVVLIKSLKDETEDLKNKNSILHKFIEDTTDNGQLMKLNLNLEQTITKLKTELSDIKTKNEHLTIKSQDFESLNISLVTKNMTNGKIINSLQADKIAMKQEISTLKDELDTKSKEALTNIETIQSLTTKRNELEKNIQTLEQKLNDIESAGVEKELESLKEKQKQLETNNQVLQKQLDDTQSAKLTNEKEIDLLKKKHDELENVIQNEKQLNVDKSTESVKDKQEINVLKQNQKTLEEMIKDLKKELKTKESKKADKEPVKVDKESATVDKKDAKADKEVKKDKYEEMKLLKEQKNKLEKTIESLEKKLKDNQIKETARNEEVELLKNSKLECEEIIQMIKTQLDEKINESKEKMDSLKEELKKSETIIETLNAKLEKYKSEKSTTDKKDMEKLQSKLETDRKSRELLDQQISTLSNEKKVLEDQLKQCRQKINTMQAAIDASESAAVTNKIKTLQEEIRQLKTEKEKLKLRLSELSSARVHSDPNVVELSLQEQQKVIKSITDLYDDEWEELCIKLRQSKDDKEATDYLLNILFKIYAMCSKYFKNIASEKKIKLDETNSSNYKTFKKDLFSNMSEYKKKLMQKYKDQFIRNFIGKEKDIPLLINYLSKCFECCWLFITSLNPATFGPVPEKYSRFNPDEYTHYIITGTHVSYLVFPVLKRSNMVINKGVVKTIKNHIIPEKTPKEPGDYTIYLNQHLKLSVYQIKFENVKDIDVLVNAGNSTLGHGAGIARAIAMKAGEKFVEDGNKYIQEHGSIKVSENNMMRSYQLSQFQAIMNAVGPIWSNTKSPEENAKILCETIVNILNTVNNNKYSSVAIPAISSQIFKFPESICSAMYVKGFYEFAASIYPNPSEDAHTINHIHFFDIREDIITRVLNDIKRWNLEEEPWYFKWENMAALNDKDKT